MVMPLIEDASRRIGVEPHELFESAATLVAQPGATNLMRWLGRQDEDRTIECMGFVVGSDEQGFRYRYKDSEPMSAEFLAWLGLPPDGRS